MELNKLASAILNDILSGLRGITSNISLSVEQLEDDIVDERLTIIKEYALKKIAGNCDDVTESIGENLKYNESCAESRKMEKEMREIFSNEENAVFEIYLELLVDIQSEENLLFYEAMLQTGAYLNKIEEITEV